MCCMRLREFQVNMDSRSIFCFSIVGPDEQQIGTKACFISDGTTENPRFQTQRRETVVMISACPDCPGLL